MMEQQTLIAAIKLLARPMRPVPPAPAPALRCPDLSGIRAVLFDVYGTLMQSGSGEIGLADAGAADRAEYFRAALDAAGIRPAGAGAGARGAAAMSAAIRRRHDAARAAGSACPEVDIEDIWQTVLAELHQAGLAPADVDSQQIRRAAVEYECRVNPVWPMPGLPACLAPLRQNGIQLGIVSNAQFFTPLLFPALTGRELTELGFDLKLCAWSYRTGLAKPAPEIFQAALQALQAKYGIPPQAVLAVGNDLLNDIAGAAACGCRTALFAGDARSLRRRTGDPRCAGIRPDWVIADLHQLSAPLLKLKAPAAERTIDADR